ncbi:glycosyltransferase family 2 protein [Leeuwenhoekiella polynyae]|uniref:Glycosyltransferase involved in cell wall biosynthesis n=1 Tax=Leeuwenhoekiella polynyae TaxID=1550906 RepID=A0A4Q0PG79_9FLAO|nr:glycosyltransferase [Leeuwenhoekiella polynyae]RXG25179.1 glycosyltransferase involved in cell wall biosynthesis [Leeuwenhoekiella polynyae]
MIPRVSIVLPVYNGQKHLNEAIESVIDQSNPNFELIIIDDDSTDKSPEIAKKYLEIDSRIQFYSNPENKKLPYTLNKGFSMARGEFLTWTSHDNKLKVNFIERFLKEFDKGHYKFIYSKEDFISNKGEKLHNNKNYNFNSLIFSNAIGASFMYRRVVFEEIGKYNENLFLIEDYDYWMRVSEKFEIGFINESLYQYRYHGESLSTKIKSDLLVNEEYTTAVEELFKNFVRHNTSLSLFLKSLFLGELNNVYQILKSFELYSFDLREKIMTNKALEWDEVQLNFYLIVRQIWKRNYEKVKFIHKLYILFKWPRVLFSRKFSYRKSLKLMCDIN